VAHTLRTPVAAAGALLILSGCSHAISGPPYQASNGFRSRANVSLGRVDYLPATRGIVASNRFFPKVGSIYFADPVANYVRKALTAELERSGFAPLPSGLVLECEIERFGINRKAFGIESVLTLKLILNSQATGSTIAWKTIEESRSHSLSASFNTIINDLNAMLLAAYERFFQEAQVVKAVSPGA
jgi:hypothetical protein